MLVLVVGPSGAGKDTLIDGARQALAGDARFRFVRRAITRPESAGGEDHEFVAPEEFARRRAAGGYALHWHAHGLDYGIPVDIAEDLRAGRVVVANVSRAVVADAAMRFPVRVLAITAPVSVRAGRLAARGREAVADIAARLAREDTLPEGADIVMNDATPQEGIARVLAVLSRAAGTAAPG